MRFALICALMQHVVVISYQRFGTTYQSHLLDPSRYDQKVVLQYW